MTAKQLHWLDVGEWVAIAIAGLSLAVATVTNIASWPPLLLAAALIVAVVLNAIKRHWQESSYKRLQGKLKQLQYQWSEVRQALQEGYSEAPPTAAAASSEPDTDKIATLQANLAALEQSLDTVVHYLQEIAFPERVAQLEQVCAQLQQEIRHLCDSLSVPPTAEPPPAATTTPPAAPSLTLPVIPALSWQCRHILTDHGAAVPSLAIAPNGRWLASASWDQSLKLWDLTGGKLLASLVGHSQGLLAIAFLSQKGLATGSFDQSIKLWSLLPGERGGIEIKLGEILTAHTGSVHALAAVPELRLLVSGSYDQTTKQWDWEQGELLCSSYDPLGAIYAIAVSADAAFVASGGGDGQVALWRLRTGERLGLLAGNVSSIESLAIAPDGKAVAAGCVDGSIKIWQPSQSSVRPLQAIAAHAGQVKSLAFTPDGQLLVSGGADGQVKFWHPSRHDPLVVLALAGEGLSRPCAVSSLVLSPDGQFLAAGGVDGRIIIWQQAESI